MDCCKCRCAFFDPEKIKKITNEVPDLGYYTNESSGSVPQNSNIPLEETLLLGENISTINSSTINLETGIYDITFSVVSTPSADGDTIVSLYVNNSQSNITSSMTAIAGGNYALASNGIIVANSNTLLNLKNVGSSSATFSMTNLVIEKKN